MIIIQQVRYLLLYSCISIIIIKSTLGKHKIPKAVDEIWWMECCGALANMIQALLSVTELDRSLSLILISDRLNLSTTIRLLGLIPPKGM